MLSLTIRNQDTLIGLGRRLFNSPTAWREVARLNRLSNPNRLAPGQVIEVPERLLRWVEQGGHLVLPHGVGDDDGVLLDGLRAQLLGGEAVLDVTSRSGLMQQHLLVLLGMTARMIENRLIDLRFRDAHLF